LPIPEFVAPSAKVTLSTPLEVLLGSIWSDVLGRSEIGRDDDIFALGADSIQIFQIVARANRAGIVILARDIMQKRTIGKIVSGLDVAKPGQGRRLSRAPVSRNDESESIQANAR
jgi:aryl carrier-like protein